MNNAKNVDYSLSEKMQNIFGSRLTNRPLRKNVQLASYRKPFSAMTMMQKYDSLHVETNKQKLISEWSGHYSKSQG